MVEQHGIEYEERKHSQLFCRHTAKEILAMLLQECDSAGVEIKTHCEINSLAALAKIDQPGREQSKNPAAAYRVDLTQGHSSMVVDCESLVVATGALSIPSLGGSGLGYEIARQFSLPVTTRRAGLVPLMFSDATRELCERLSGVSLPVEVSCNQQTFSESILFTHRGISGPAILQISNYWQPGDELVINLLPGVDAAEWLLLAKQQEGKTRLKTLLNKNLPRALVNELQTLWWPASADTPLAGYSDKQLTAIGDKVNQWRLKPSASEGYRTAEVTLGGVDTASISSKTMEAKQHRGLFFIGEVLDITGHLGGFNFQWAWSSGYSAGLVV
jgi:predicted Rossmann fold flavoprotein